ncbi:HAD family hydrolase [Paenibacillus xerothermodurans]|uniref:HAD family hydrolase n=1 Tax=Paenibacillus xerothermodurans TaxID=1977292 RepID=A0A2W1P112_PAEXE|nr:HAD family hydrolase [Paenibacillus xerothermodurans]PZE21422.1 HAD family hydrolase [Paenibacillus xerothermodurans]
MAHRLYDGIIFDMDNTLLRSNIDFAEMKLEIFRYLVERRVLPADMPIKEHTTATLIEHAKQLRLAPELERDVWAIAAKHELAGMKEAGLERGAAPFLASLSGEFTLTVVTNISHAAALQALEQTGLAHFFDIIAGREQMAALKPSPSGFHYVMERCRAVRHDRWISVGDAWIDGKAANAAGIPFLSYQTEPAVMTSRGVDSLGTILEISEMKNFLFQ